MRLDYTELKAVVTVAIIMASRLLGIFLILPVFSVYAEKYPGSSIAMAGVAFGIYALAQSVFQVPFGWASDKLGRKPVLLAGLLIFTVGSVLCAEANTINELIIARIIQGMGAVSSVAIAALGDLTRPQVRAQSFTIVGITIGIAFLVAIILGPYLAAKLGFSSVFYVLAGSGALALLLTLFFFPKIENGQPVGERAGFRALLRMPEMRRLLLATVVVSLSVNLFVFVYPLTWMSLGVSDAALWKVYLISLIPTALFVFPAVRIAEKKGRMGVVVKAGWGLVALAFLTYPVLSKAALIFYGAGMLFFAGHTIMQSILPAFVTHRVSQANRGAATGLYNLLSFAGSSAGGIMAGYLYHLHPSAPLTVGFLVIIAWGLAGLPTAPDVTGTE